MSKELILQKDTMIVSETDMRGNIIYANSDFCKISGFCKDELIGQAHNIVRHPDMPKAAFKDLWETVKKEHTWRGIVKNRTKDGDYYWVNATAFISTDGKGNQRLISIRVKPTDDEIRDAQKLYKTLN